MRTKKYADEVIEKDPAAVFINLTKEPEVKSLLPALRKSARIQILEENDRYIIFKAVSPKKSKSKSWRRVKQCKYSKKFSSTPIRKQIKAKKTEAIFTQFNQGVGIDARPIQQADEHTDLVNVCGIFF